MSEIYQKNIKCQLGVDYPKALKCEKYTNPPAIRSRPKGKRKRKAKKARDRDRAAGRGIDLGGAQKSYGGPVRLPEVDTDLTRLADELSGKGKNDKDDQSDSPISASSEEPDTSDEEKYQ